MYILLAVGVTWPLAPELNNRILGYPTIDAMDTIMLRGLVSELLFFSPADIPTSTGIYFPVGMPVLQWTPNLLDHLIGGGLATLFGFPAGDNLFWLALLAANGLAAHRLGHQLTGSHSSAFLVGVAYALSENLLRETNLHHAPQALTPFAPLYLAGMLRVLDGAGRRDQVATGFWMGLSGVAYWYTAIFLAFATVFLIRSPRQDWRPIATVAGISLLIAAPFLVPFLLHLDELSLATLTRLPEAQNTSAAFDFLPEGQGFLVEHGGDPLLLFNSATIDTSNKVAITLLLAVGLSLRRGASPRFVGIAAFGAVMAMGPYLKWGPDPVIWGDSPIPLPFRWLSELHPVFERLTWPERWGVLIALGLAAAASKAPKPRLLAVLLITETLLVSPNAPLQSASLESMNPWRRLQAVDGAVLELPIARTHRQAPFVGLHARMHGRPVVNPILRPPESPPPRAWQQWLLSQPIHSVSESLAADQPPPQTPGLSNSLDAAGIGAVALDTGESSGLKSARLRRWREGLSALLGEPEDQGALLIWWIRPPTSEVAPPLSYRGVAVETGQQWRSARDRDSNKRSSPSWESLIEPLWFP